MSSEAYLKAERASWLKTKTTTKDGGYYDRVIAVSQSMVNSAFVDMHKKHVPLQKVAKALNKDNEIVGNLHPTELLISPGTGKIYWMIHFKDGWIKTNAMGVTGVIYLDDWRLAVEVEFATDTVKFLDDDPPHVTEAKEKQLQNLEGKYSWKADRYDPSYLYAKLTTGLGRGFSWDYSTFGKDGKGGLLKHTDLITRGSLGMSGDMAFAQLNTFLVFWANDLHAGGLTTVATQFRAPAAASDVRGSSFPVNEMVLQTSPYILDVPGETGYKQGVVSLDDPGSRNCICYCELISEHTLEASKRVLPVSGNFSTVGKSKEDRIDGTFVLSRNLFFERFLFETSNLRNFASASIISPKAAVFTQAKNKVTATWSRDYGVYYKDISRLKFEARANEFYFSYTGVPVSSGTTPFQNDKTKRYYYHEAEASSEMFVRWTPGSKDVVVSGRVKYGYIETGTPAPANGEVPKINNGEIANPDSWLKEFFKADWSFKFALGDIADGELRMRITEDLNVTVARDDARSKVQYFNVPQSQKADIQNELKKSLTAQLDGLRVDLEKALKSELKYVYPGTRTFTFGNVVFNNNGDLLVDIKYITGLDTGIIVVPDPYEILDPVRPTPVTGKEASTTQSHPDTTLSWSITKTARARSFKQPITLTVTNDTKELVRMKTMEVSIFVTSDLNPPTGGTSYLSISPLIVQVTDLKQSVDPATSVVMARDEPSGSLGLLPCDVKPVTRSRFLTKWSIVVKAKKDPIEFPVAASLVLDFLIETGHAGICDVSVLEKEWAAEGTPNPRGGKLQVTLEA
ncbi:hypothetical protein BDV95DRAFT_182569 [Massariosphaeria phaeospora]|uniref:Uncharacterized protein n=1 Tax=Massariosphaeria phaeospora TaxID=100035 RepID=A0A7C8M3F8_9PLEO|nr:hypothetical protein BDV95DRAFT_182569 [Massariosphaeria phaeospora]